MKVCEQIITENLFNLGNEIAKSRKCRVPYRSNPKRNTPRHIITKMTKIKTREHQKQQGKNQQITYKGAPIRLSADFSTETPQARREWQSIVKLKKGKNLQPRKLHPARLSFRFEFIANLPPYLSCSSLCLQLQKIFSCRFPSFSPFHGWLF